MKKNKQGKRPNLSPAVLLRPRLDGLLQNPGWVDRAPETIQADLHALIRGIRPEDYLPVLMNAISALPAAAQAKLSPSLAQLLQEEGTLDALQTLVQRHQLPTEATGFTRALLAQRGVDLDNLLPAQEETFYQAYEGEDEYGSQGLLFFFWYANRQRNRVRGMSWLLDFNPPWDGAAKDIMLYGQKPPAEMFDFALRRWFDQGIGLEEIDAVTAKRRAIEILQINLDQQIRLHRDFQEARQDFAEHILALPDGPDTPPFTLDDYDFLCRNGRRSEAINQFERTVGRVMRLEDGKELFVDANIIEDDR
jgi:hypothetical protein